MRKRHDDKKYYVFVDPFNSSYSGVTSYVNSSIDFLSSSGQLCRVIGKRKHESISKFRKRVAVELAAMKEEVMAVEAPESLASTILVPKDIDIHIRLHCSKSLGALVQGESVDKREVSLEQSELFRAKWVSSPSWAAIYASTRLFELPSQISCFPNPVVVSRCLAQGSFFGDYGDYDVLFVGRFQFLKGSQYLLELADLLPDRKFAVVSTGETFIGAKIPENVTFFQSSHGVKEQLYRIARLVVVPSVFEAASMVGLEALAFGCPVVTWEHIGLAEYGANSSVIRIRPFDLISMASAIDNQCMLEVCKSDEDLCDEVNRKFICGFQRLILESCNIVNLPRPSAEIIDFLKDFSVCRTVDECKKGGQVSRFKRKFRKLVRNPRKFFIDSQLVKVFVRPGSGLDDGDAPSSPHKTLSDAPLNTEKPYRFFIEIQRTGKVVLSEPRSKNTGWITGFMYPKDVKPLADGIIDSLYSLTDFLPTRRGQMEIGEFCDLEEGPLEIVNRIDLANKNKLQSYRNLILLDAPLSLCVALRSCAADLRVFLIKTNNEEQNLLGDLGAVDALIDVGGVVDDEIKSQVRRSVTVDAVHEVCLAIRRLIQESGPKQPDMLLPLVGGAKFAQGELLNFESSRCQGIIKLKSVGGEAADMHSLYREIAQNVEAMAILESVYMRYKNLCQGVENGESLGRLLECCLYDGALFYVE